MGCRLGSFLTAIAVLCRHFGRPCCRYYSVRFPLARRTILRRTARAKGSIVPSSRSLGVSCRHDRTIGTDGCLIVSLLSTALGLRLQDRVLSSSCLDMSRSYQCSLLLVSLVDVWCSQYPTGFGRCSRCFHLFGTPSPKPLRLWRRRRTADVVILLYVLETRFGLARSILRYLVG